MGQQGVRYNFSDWTRVKARDDNCISIGEMEGLTLYEIFRYSYSGPLANNFAVQLYKSALCDCKDYPYIGICVMKKNPS